MHLLAPVMGELCCTGGSYGCTHTHTHTHQREHPLPCTFWHPLWENFAAQGVHTAAYTDKLTHTNASTPCHTPSDAHNGSILLHRGFVWLHATHARKQQPVRVVICLDVFVRLTIVHCAVWRGGCMIMGVCVCVSMIIAYVHTHTYTPPVARL